MFLFTFNAYFPHFPLLLHAMQCLQKGSSGLCSKVFWQHGSAAWCRQPCHPCCMQHSSVQMGVTAFAAVLHPRYVLQQNLSDFVFTFILETALIKIASVCII